MKPRSAVVIVVDRVGAGFLGPFGNSWIDTPALNRLASQSLICEQAFATDPSLHGVYRALGSGQSPLSAFDDCEATQLLTQLAASGLRTTLLTDELDLVDSPFGQAFLQTMPIATESLQRPADSAEQTQMAHSFAAAIEWLEQSRDPFLLWLHLSGMSGAWDAPSDFRRQFADDDDPPPPTFVAPPNRKLDLETDPDELLGIGQAYAGQVVLLDMCMEMLLDVLDQHPRAADTLLIFTSPRGFPIGEHGGVGPAGDALYEETVHVPLLVRTPNRNRAMERERALLQHADLAATLAEWFGLDWSTKPRDGMSLLRDELSPEGHPPREMLISEFGAERSLRTTEWLLCQTAEQTTKLFAKPDDRWEANEVADRCVEITEALAGKLAACFCPARTD